MQGKNARKTALLSDIGALDNPEDNNTRPMFSGLNLAVAIEQLKTCNFLRSTGQLNKPEVSAVDCRLQTENKPENHAVNGLFSGLNLDSPDIKKILKTYFTQTELSVSKKSANDKSSTVKLRTPEIHLSNIRTSDVIASLLKVKKNKRVKESALATYKKRLLLFQKRFAFLPENPEAIMDYLSRFDGESGRHRRNHQDLLNMLYRHATRRFGLEKNPILELERPIVTHKPAKTLSLEQVKGLNQTPEDLQERTALDLLVGHGWRQVETRRVQAKDVAAIDHHLILCHGKERDELAPVLPETEDGLREMAKDLEPDDFLFVARQKRHGRRAPLGEDGMSQLAERLLSRSALEGFTGHDLRRTFTTLVTMASHDEFLAMRLIRDKIPGHSERYVRYAMDQLVEALEKYSPIRQAGEFPPRDDNEARNIQKVSPSTFPLNKGARPSNSLVETGESRTPPETTFELLTSWAL